jgi:hypothetical protein
MIAFAELMPRAGRMTRCLLVAAATVACLTAAQPSHGETALNACTAKQVPLLVAFALTCQDSSTACESAIRAAELHYRLPAGLLDAIGRVESGRPSPLTHDIQPWPWTIQAEGVGRYFDSELDAVRWVQQAMLHGVQSIDAGCMQVNLMYHPNAFISLTQAFDPVANVDYAARFLLRLYASTQDWQQAIGFYHSHTPTLAAEYRQRIARANAAMAVLPPSKLSVIAQLSQAWRATLPGDKADLRAATQ